MHDRPPNPPPAPNSSADRLALIVVVGRRLLWLVAGVALMRTAARGMRPHADATVLAGHALLGIIGAAMMVYAVRSAARAVLDIDTK